jgi:hypothetical protein
MFALIPAINEIYTLTVTSKDKLTQQLKLKPVALIDEIIQNDKADLLETTLKSKLILMIQLTSKYYLYNYSYSNQVLQNFYVDEDTFIKEINF